jgi:hypothetical protein
MNEFILFIGILIAVVSGLYIGTYFHRPRQNEKLVDALETVIMTVRATPIANEVHRAVLKKVVDDALVVLVSAKRMK